MPENKTPKIILSNTGPDKVYVVRQEDAAILREGLAHACRRAHPSVRQHLIGYLSRYAAAVKEYCACPQQVYSPKEGENTFACLDCGKRVQKEKPKLEIAKP